jgi:hypothetical protein
MSNSNVIILLLFVISFVLIGISEQLSEKQLTPLEKQTLDQKDDYDKALKKQNMEKFEISKKKPLSNWNEDDYFTAFSVFFSSFSSLILFYILIIFSLRKLMRHTVNNRSN